MTEDEVRDDEDEVSAKKKKSGKLKAQAKKKKQVKKKKVAKKIVKKKLPPKKKVPTSKGDKQATSELGKDVKVGKLIPRIKINKIALPNEATTLVIRRSPRFTKEPIELREGLVNSRPILKKHSITPPKSVQPQQKPQLVRPSSLWVYPPQRPQFFPPTNPVPRRCMKCGNFHFIPPTNSVPRRCMKCGKFHKVRQSKTQETVNKYFTKKFNGCILINCKYTKIFSKPLEEN